MNWKTIGRILVCLLLVCCLIVNISPIKAEADVAGAVVAFKGIAAFAVPEIICPVLIGLGIGYVVNQTGVFDDLVNQISTALEAAGLASGGYIDTVVGTDGNYYINQEIAEWVHGWLFENDVVVPPATWVQSLNFTFDGTTFYLSRTAPFTLVCIHAAYGTRLVEYVYAFMESGTSGTFYRDYKSVTLTSGTYHSYASVCGSISSSLVYAYDASCGIPLIDLGTFDSFDEYQTAVAALSFGTTVSTNMELSLSNVASSDMDFATGYPTWAGNSIFVGGGEVGNDEDQQYPYIPVGLGQTYEESRDMSQEQVQAGESTYVAEDTEADTGTDTGTDTESGTSSGVIEGSIAATPWTTYEEFIARQWADTKAIITAIPEAIGQVVSKAISDIFVPSEDYITAKVEALRANFGFIDSIIVTGEAIRDSLSGASGPPAIYVDLGAAEGDTYWGGKVLLTDFAWYSRYKGTVDSWLSAALWAFFGWRVFQRLPGIISGESGYIGDVVAHKEKVEKIKAGPPTGKKKE